MRFVVVVIGIVGLMFSAACGDGDSPNGAATSPSGQSTSSSPADTTPTAVSAIETATPTESSVTGFYCLWFNANKPPFDDGKFSEGLLASIDEDEITEELAPRRVDASTGTAPESIGSHACLGADVGHDVRRARTLVSQSAYAQDASRPEIELVALLGEDAPAIAEVLKDTWKREFNLDVKIFLAGDGVTLKNQIDDGTAHAFLIVLPP